MLAEATAGIAIVMLLIGGLGMVMGRERAAVNQLADRREAMTIAENVLTSMQHGVKPARVGEQTSVNIEPIDVRLTLPTTQWVKVTVEHKGQTVELTGMVPRPRKSGGGTP
jgi:hypothetical protein